MTKTYIVIWEIEIDADSPRHATEQALEIQRDPESTATVFRVVDPKTRKVYEGIDAEQWPHP